MSGEATYHILHFLSSYLTGERSDFESWPMMNRGDIGSMIQTNLSLLKEECSILVKDMPVYNEYSIAIVENTTPPPPPPPPPSQVNESSGDGDDSVKDKLRVKGNSVMYTNVLSWSLYYYKYSKLHWSDLLCENWF